MYIYNVTINVEADVKDEWVQWMKHSHMPEVMATGCFLTCQLCQLMVEEETGVTYAAQYTFETESQFLQYQNEFAPQIQKKTADKYGEKALAFRTVLKVL